VLSGFLIVLDDGFDGAVEADQKRNVAGYDLSKHPHTGAYLTFSAFILNQASQDFSPYAVLVFGDSARLASFFNGR
jgi:hypothetical protein